MTLAELRDVTEIWVDITMQLGPQDLRRMERLQTAQDRRLSKVHAYRPRCMPLGRKIMPKLPAG